jgi:hypothetical protein
MNFGRLRHNVEFQFVILQKDLQLIDLCAFGRMFNIMLHAICVRSSAIVTEEIIREKKTFLSSIRSIRGPLSLQVEQPRFIPIWYRGLECLNLYFCFLLLFRGVMLN